MNEFNIEIRKIKSSEYQVLRKSANWSSFDLETVERALENDLFSVCVMDQDKTIGIGRVIGDGAIYYYIQDVIVLPEYQKRGVGNMIMERIEAYLNQHASTNTFIGLMAAKGAGDFYKRYSYRERSGDSPGMFRVIKQ